MTAREHLQHLHKSFADHFREKSAHHEAVAKSHEEHASLHDELAKSTGVKAHKDFASRHRADGAVHKSMAAHYTKKAASHDDMAESCAKGMDTGDLTKLMPTGISGVTPTRPGITAVPRFGQREVSATAGKPNVDPQFEKLFTIDDAEEERSVTKSIG
jgi:hypothetical protein